MANHADVGLALSVYIYIKPVDNVFLMSHLRSGIEYDIKARSMCGLFYIKDKYMY